MAKRVGKYKITKRESALNLIDGGTASGEIVFGGGYSGKRKIVDLDATTYAPTAAQSGTIFTFDGTVCEVTLPTCAVGLEYFFLVKTTQSANASITTQSADKLYGLVNCVVDGVQTAHSNTTKITDCNTGTNDNTFTMNGTTTGGIIGSFIHVFGMKANAWHISGNTIGSGTLVTAFS